MIEVMTEVMIEVMIEVVSAREREGKKKKLPRARSKTASSFFTPA